MSRSAVIVDAVRSPMGKGRPERDDRSGGCLSSLHAVELLAQVIGGLIRRNDLDPGLVEDVLIGSVSQAAEQSATPGRWAWLAAGFPEHVPSTTIDRRCGSSQQAIDFGAQGIIAGAYDVVVAGGIESMSRVPMGSARMGADPFGPSVSRRFAPGLVPQGVSAELVAARWHQTRDELDAYAYSSHQRAAAVADRGGFAAEIIPIVVPDRAGGSRSVHADETIRPSTTTRGLAELRPAFQSDEMARRFPEIGWHITAGNSSQITDGASAVLLVEERTAERLGLRARARVRGFALAADDPILMLTAPIPATEKVLRRTGLRIDDIDHFEVNEAFASVPLAWREHFDVPSDRLNPRGGAIALGHPLGASGGRLMTTLVNGLEATRGRYGLQTMCEAGGTANATIIERL